MISNRHGIEVFYTAFKQACGEEYSQQNNYGQLDSTKFYYSIILLSEVLYQQESSPFEAMFSNILVDKHLTTDQRCKFSILNIYNSKI